MIRSLLPITSAAALVGGCAGQSDSAFGGFVVSDEPLPAVSGCLAVLASGATLVNGQALPGREFRRAAERLINSPQVSLGVYTEFPAGAGQEEAGLNVLYGDALGPFLKRTGRTVQMIPSERADCSDLQWVQG